jgi:threonine aldolase
LENTHNRGGGRVVPLGVYKRLCKVAREHGLFIHLDGARIFNASIASRVPVASFAEDVDSVMFCLSKGLSCPLGPLVVGSSHFIEEAKRVRRRIGGGMRQAAVIAAYGIVALEDMIDRLVDDHENAQFIAEGVNETKGLKVDIESVEKNMVYINHSSLRFDTKEVLRKFKDNGVLSSGRPPDHFRIVITRHHDKDIIIKALKRMKRAIRS